MTYALALGCVLFLCITLNLALNSAEDRNIYSGVDIVAGPGWITSRRIKNIESALKTTYSGLWKDLAYVSRSLEAQMGLTLDASVRNHGTKLELSDMAKMGSTKVYPFALNAANFYFDDSFKVDFNANDYN